MKEAEPTTTTTVPFEARAREAFAPLSSFALTLPGDARAWLAGELPDDQYRAKLTAALADATEAHERVDALPDAPGKELYLASTELYVQHVRVHQASMDLPGAARAQAVLLARRLRELADRVFDRGHAVVDPSSTADGNVELNLPEEVPDWVAEGMAAGPPLDAAPPPAASTPPLRQATRPTEPERDWLDAVRAAGAPAELDLDGDLAAQARAYVAAAESLRTEPDPDVEGGRERSAVLRLGWLISADAARAAQLGLRDIAQSILGASDALQGP